MRWTVEKALENKIGLSDKTKIKRSFLDRYAGKCR